MVQNKKLKKTLILFVMLSAIAFSPAMAQEKILMMATTTSTDNTGLLDYLAPAFREQTGIELRWTATGTGKALKLGENCDVDVLMVHAPEAEKSFVAAGFGIDRRQIMYNDFVIIGPEKDPAGVKGGTIAQAMVLISEKQMFFTSRGDNSGTHKKELFLWKSAGIPVPEKAAWYLQTGQGMLSTINVAAQRDGYTMTDRGTYIKYEDSLKGTPPLKILVEGDAALMNQYSVIAINPSRCPTVKKELAEAFIDWITSPAAQRKIGDFKVLGKVLFTPNAKKE